MRLNGRHLLKNGSMRGGACALLLLGLFTSPLFGQNPPLPETSGEEEVEEPEFESFGVSPGGAFLRAIAVPGWGHASIESYTRGGFYFLTETGTFWMIARSIRRVSDARDVRSARESLVEARLRAEGVPEEEIADAVADDPSVASAQTLVEAREQQRQDWVALGIFLVLLSGADAFVSAHLKDFPAPVSVTGSATEDGFEFGLRIPVGGR